MKSATQGPGHHAQQQDRKQQSSRKGEPNPDHMSRCANRPFDTRPTSQEYLDECLPAGFLDLQRLLVGEDGRTLSFLHGTSLNMAPRSRRGHG